MIGKKSCSSSLLKRSKSSLHSLCTSGSESSCSTIRSRKSSDVFQSVSSNGQATSTSQFRRDRFPLSESMSRKGSTSCLRKTKDSVASKDQGSMIQIALMLAIACQLPGLFFYLCEVLDLHYHSFPVLVVLGVFPKFLLKKRHRGCPTSSLHNQSFLNQTLSSHSGSLLKDIEEYYRQCGLETSPIESGVRLTAAAADLKDEWGHFADFDETPDCVFLQSTACLSPLQEIEEEE